MLKMKMTVDAVVVAVVVATLCLIATSTTSTTRTTSLLTLVEAKEEVNTEGLQPYRQLQTQQQQQQQECTLNCPDFAPCRFGDADFSHHVNDGDVVVELGSKHATTTTTTGTNNHNGMHCDCPIGWTGVLCNIKFETCDNQAGHECYHNGSCIPGLHDKYGNTQLFCDCSTAINPIDGTQFVGKYCETPFEQVCTAAPSVGSGGQSQQQQQQPQPEEAFCVNGSTCNPNWPESSNAPCICEDGYEGYHCEFQVGTVPECTLECQNGGVCFIGVFSASDAQQLVSMDYIWTIEQQEDHMRCICPPDFNGGLCESRVEVCDVDNTGNDDLSSSSSICLNGGSCVTTTRTDHVTGQTQTRHHCDCTEATTDGMNRFAGKYCEHVATSFCDEDDFNLFCTQGGVCKSNPIEGCDCSTAPGTAGYKCEFILDNDNIEDDGSNSDGDDLPTPTASPIVPSPPPESEPCGDGVCLHGGSCVVVDVLLEDGTRGTEEVCDCTYAITNDAAYAGPYCQYRSTSFCPTDDDDDENNNNSITIPESSLVGVPFCVHHGECQPDGSCNCGLGWTGDHCELKTVDGTHNEGDNGDSSGVTCGDTMCYNGGICVETEVTVGGTGFVAGSNNDSDITGDDLITEIKTHCDCSSAFDDHFLYAGESCEFPSTQLCSIPDPQLGSLEGTLFCTNHGQCQQNPQLGCLCNDGFYGTACEYERLNDEDGDGIPNDEDEDYNDGNGIDDMYESCGDDGLICHNGGSCMTVTETNDETGDTTTIYQCDCSLAFGSDGTTEYLGERCEYPVTTSCGPFQGCTNGGTCKSNTAEGCNCPHGFTGLFCEYKSTVDEIIDTPDAIFQQCDEDLVCLNGGTCATTVIAGLDGDDTGINYCDCSTAFTDTEIFAGEFCEHKATTFCTIGGVGGVIDDSNGNGSLEGTLFCTNGGRCKPNHLEGCECDPGWEGSSCEFSSDMDYDIIDDDDEILPGGDDSLFSCNLNCRNGGVCAQGAKDLGYLQDVIGDVSHLNSTFHADEFAHCICEDGWVGLLCDHKIEVCGEDEHYCLHGSKCVEKNGKHECDCSQADEDVGTTNSQQFAGDSCEHAATDICTIGGTTYPGQPLYFCVNGGECNAYVESGADNPGCRCSDEWTGPHCEIFAQSSQSSQRLNDIGPIIGFVIAALVGLLALLLTGKWLVSTKRRGNNKTDAATNDKPSSNNNNPHAFPRRRRRAGFRGSTNLAPAKRSSLADASLPGVMNGTSSSSTPNNNSPPLTPFVGSGMTLPPDDEPDAFQDEPDGIFNHRSGADSQESVDEPSTSSLDNGSDHQSLENVDFV